MILLACAMCIPTYYYLDDNAQKVYMRSIEDYVMNRMEEDERIHWLQDIINDLAERDRNKSGMD